MRRLRDLRFKLLVGVFGIGFLLNLGCPSQAAEGDTQPAQADPAPPSTSLSFRYPVPAFPYFHVHCVFAPQSYSPFTIESVEVNDKPVQDYRVLRSTGRVYGRPEAIPGLEANDGNIPTDRGFSMDIPCHWQAGGTVQVAVVGPSESGEVQELQVSGRAPGDSVGLPGWKHSAAVVVQETAGIDRRGEPVEVTLGLIHQRVTDPLRELRVVALVPGTPNRDDWQRIEVPSQVLDVTVWKDQELLEKEEKDVKTGEPIHRYMPTTTVQLVFLAEVPAYGERVYLICYGNPRAPAPLYRTDLQVEKGEGLSQTISNDYYRIGLSSNSAAIETVVVKGEPEVLLEHRIETNGAVHWNPGIYSPPDPWVHASDWENPPLTIHTGPLVHRLSRYANLPFITTTAAQVTYQFFAGQPYLLCETVMEVKEDLFVQALRNGEIVFNQAVLNEFVWQDERGRIHSLDLATARKHPTHGLEIPADTPWIAFISREQGVGFAGITLENHHFNLYGRLDSLAQPYFYVQVGPWIYWSRGLVYPFGHTNFTRMMPVRKGSIYAETNAYLPFRLAEGAHPFAAVERYQKILTQPLRVTEHIPRDPDTPRQWIMPLLTAPFNEGVQDAQSAKEVPESEQ